MDPVQNPVVLLGVNLHIFMLYSGLYYIEIKRQEKNEFLTQGFVALRVTKNILF